MIPTALHSVRGYELFQDNGHPYVMREWTSFHVNDAGERVKDVNRLRLELIPEHFTGGKQAKAVYDELVEAWRAWTEWRDANKRG